MNKELHTQDWDQDLKDVLGNVPAPNFDKWRAKYALSASEHGTNPIVLPSLVSNPLARPDMQNRRWAGTLLKLAASVLLVCGAAWFVASTLSTSNTVFAADILGVDGVKFLSWTETFFIRVTSADQKRTWIEKEKVDVLYQHPGKFRKTHFDRKGEVIFIEIFDMQANRALRLNPSKHQAELKFPTERPDERGPFAWVGDYIRGQQEGKVSLKGNHTFDGIDSSVIQWKGKQTDGVVKFYLAVEDKRLAGISSMNPGVKFDPETYKDNQNPPAEEA